MTDNQFYALLGILATGLAGIGAAIRWSVSRVTTAMERNTAAMIENTKSNAVLSTKIDAISGYVERTEQRSRSSVPSNVKEFVRAEIHEEISGVHESIDAIVAAGSSSSSGDDRDTREQAPLKRAPSLGGGEYGPAPKGKRRQ